jgi:cytochrome c oxidase assembly factor CtaG
VWPQGAIIPYLLAADVQNTVLAAILTFSDRVLYPWYAQAPHVGGLTPLHDQMLAGVLMWVPMSLVYVIPAVVLTARLLWPGRSAVYAH